MRFAKPKKGKPVLLSKCAVFSTKKSIFIKEQDACELLSSFGITTGFDELPIPSPILCSR